VQETAIEESGTFDFPQLPTNFPELAGFGQMRYIPEWMPIKSKPTLMYPVPGGYAPRYIPEQMPIPVPSRRKFPIYRRRIIPRTKPRPVEIPGFSQVPVAAPHIEYQGIVDILQTPTGTTRDSASGFLENTITKIGDWAIALQTTKYEAEQANAQAKLAEAKGKVTQASIMSVLPWGILAVGIVYLLKKRGR
jgi:hypothetical protein